MEFVRKQSSIAAVVVDLGFFGALAVSAVGACRVHWFDAWLALSPVR